MNTSETTSLPGIKNIYIVPARLLQPAMEYKAIVGIPIGIFTTKKKVSFLGSPSCEVVSTPQNNGSYEKATLTFSTPVPLELSEPHAFIVEDVNGRTWCIGAKEPPYSLIAFRRYTGSPTSEASVLKYTITRTSVRAMMSCHI